MRTRIAGGLFVSHLRSETDLKSHNKKHTAYSEQCVFLLGVFDSCIEFFDIYIIR